MANDKQGERCNSAVPLLSGAPTSIHGLYFWVRPDCLDGEAGRVGTEIGERCESLGDAFWCCECCGSFEEVENAGGRSMLQVVGHKTASRTVLCLEEEGVAAGSREMVSLPP